MTTESHIQREILEALNSRPDVRCWRNNVGFGFLPNGDPIRFGLCPGSSDLIGFVRQGSFARFLAVEVKSPRGRTSIEQKRFLALVTRMGGLAIVVRSPEEALGLIQSA